MAKHQQHASRIKLLKSSSTHIAAFFSVLIFISIGLVAYELYMSQMGHPLPRWVIHMAVAMLLSISVGLFAVGFYVTKRINHITETADTIMRTGDISQRIPIYQRWDDLSTLSQTLNHMLDEIQTLVHGIRTVTDNIAHDLRHPLTRLRNKIEEARSTTRTHSEEEQRVVLSGLVQECDALLNTFNALLRISNIESAKRHSGFQSISLDIVMADVLELYEPLASDKSITLQSKIEPSRVVGDKDLLFQALANVIDNAIKFTPPQGTIKISLHKTKRETIIDIEDEGPGIAAEHRAKVFNRFYRIESCRSTPGNGLGLSLVRAIIELHKGKVVISEGLKGGTVFRITL